jgi:hypothetical protein
MDKSLIASLQSIAAPSDASGSALPMLLSKSESLTPSIGGSMLSVSIDARPTTPEVRQIPLGTHPALASTIKGSGNQIKNYFDDQSRIMVNPIPPSLISEELKESIPNIASKSKPSKEKEKEDKRKTRVPGFLMRKKSTGSMSAHYRI